MNQIDFEGKAYLRKEHIGRGGMGQVFRYAETGGGAVAVKLIVLQDQADKPRIEQEAKISTQLDNPFILRTFDYGFRSENGEELLYMIMEYIPGGNLADYISKNTPAPIDTAIQLFKELASGLAYAHSVITHRDLKPSNILITGGRHPKIADFGLSKFTADATRTQTFKGWGTAAYMPPECWEMDANKPAMDIYSAGIIFYEVLTGSPPFEAKTDKEYRRMHLLEEPAPLQSVRSDTPVGLVNIIHRMLSKRAFDRYEDGAALQAALEKLDTSTAPEVDAIARRVMDKVTVERAEQLKKAESESQTQYMHDIMKYGLQNLAKMFQSAAENVNNRLGEAHLKIPDFTPGMQPYTLVQFGDQGIEIKIIAAHSDLISYIEQERQERLQRQKAQHGMILDSPRPTFIEQDWVILVCALRIIAKGQRHPVFGANLLLRRMANDDLYGEWWIAWFNDSALMAKSPLDEHYALEHHEFFKEYEFGRSVKMHRRNMVFEKLEARHINEFLDQLTR